MSKGMSPCETVGWAFRWAMAGRLGRSEAQLLQVLAQHAPDVFPSNDRLMAIMRVSEDTLQSAFAGLESKRLVTRPRDESGRVLRRTRTRPVLLHLDLEPVEQPAQMQLTLGDALVASDPAPRAAAAPPAPSVTEDELARARARLAAQAAEIAAHPAMQHRGEDSPPPSPGPVGVNQSPPEVQPEEQEEQQKRETAQERAEIPSSFEPVMGELRAEFGAQADIFDSAIAQTLRAHPESDGYEHVAAARMVVAAQHTAKAMGWQPIVVLSTKLAKELGKQRVPQRAPGRPAVSRRRGDVGHTTVQPTGRFVKKSSVEAPDFP